ncbi:hypothetical protein DBR11_20995 [Pedobacter sp. HMWF019]|uniref:hypothetical protein n=1 Tax=Pedobacter sp. HMWF019 TaxID=2056856 RepID=UPI000D397E88|nr:hypothetical protein [Pedobacter sp. HMWF019]PTS95658.1 hypothetical protein DBR11_20995 [Pedobacter sp. HMWF019]
MISPAPKVEKKLTPISELRKFYVKDKTQYNTGLIPFFIQHFQDLLPQLKPKDVQILAEVIDTKLERYTPERFELKGLSHSSGQISYTHNNSESLQAEIFFKSALILGRNDLLIKYREKLLKKLPRLDIYHNNHPKMPSLLEAIGHISEKEQLLIYEYWLARKDDLLVYSARSFAEVILELKSVQLSPILLALIDNKKVNEFDKREVLDAFAKLAQSDSDRQALSRIFLTNSNGGDPKLADIANACLVSRFTDPHAISWRIDQLKSRMRDFDDDHKYNGLRAVSDFESEMDRPQLGKCLYGIKSDQIRIAVTDLLYYSFEIRTRKLQFRYSHYLQQIIYEYFKSILSRNELLALRKSVAAYPDQGRTYGFTQYLDRLTIDLHELTPTAEPFLTAIHSLNDTMAKKYVQISSHSELKDLISKIFRNEISNLIENEGFYRVASKLQDANTEQYKPSEAIIQKTLKLALEKALMENGLRKSDIHREVQTYDDKRFDYLISYGLYGPIVVELKLLHNPEIQIESKRKSYKPKLKQYLSANHSQGIYAVFQLTKNQKHKDNYLKMMNEYEDIPGLEHILIKCLDNGE